MSLQLQMIKQRWKQVAILDKKANVTLFSKFKPGLIMHSWKAQVDCEDCFEGQHLLTSITWRH